MSKNDSKISVKPSTNNISSVRELNLAIKSDTASIHTSSINTEAKPSLNQTSKLYIISDIIALLLGFACAWVSALTVNSIFFERGDSFLTQTYDTLQIVSFLTVSSGILLWFAHSGHYRVRMPFWSETQKIICSLGLAMLIDAFLQFASKQDISRLLIISSWIYSALAIVALRMVVRKITEKNGSYQIQTLLIGAGSTAQNARKAIDSAPEMGYNITAQIKNLPEEFMQSGRSWKNLCAKYKVQHVIIAIDGNDLVGTEKIVEKLMRESIPFSVAPPLQCFPVTGMTPQYFLNHNTMIFTHNNGLEQTIPMLAKRAVDIAVSGVALLLASPIMLIIAAIVKTDGGSAFYGHKRIGRNGKIFPCLKFRSMVMGGDVILKNHLAENPEAAAEWKASQKLLNDPRVTKLGKFLRASSLDELPQLINVLRGDMSLVGPRPIVNDEVPHYSKDIAYYYRVRPGVTGLWQVSGRSDVTYAQRVQMDSWYVRNWSLWHDIAILCKTVPAVFKRSGAY